MTDRQAVQVVDQPAQRTTASWPWLSYQAGRVNFRSVRRQLGMGPVWGPWAAVVATASAVLTAPQLGRALGQRIGSWELATWWSVPLMAALAGAVVAAAGCLASWLCRGVDTNKWLAFTSSHTHGSCQWLISRGELGGRPCVACLVLMGRRERQQWLQPVVTTATVATVLPVVPGAPVLISHLGGGAIDGLKPRALTAAAGAPETSAAVADAGLISVRLLVELTGAAGLLLAGQRSLASGQVLAGLPLLAGGLVLFGLPLVTARSLSRTGSAVVIACLTGYWLVQASSWLGPWAWWSGVASTGLGAAGVAAEARAVLWARRQARPGRPATSEYPAAVVALGGRCESCRRSPATARLAYADGCVFELCAACAGCSEDAVAALASGGERQ